MNNEEKAKEIAIKNKIYYDEPAGNIDCSSFAECQKTALEMARWKDEQFDEEKKELLGLVNMLSVDEHNQTIIEDLKALLQ